MTKLSDDFRWSDFRQRWEHKDAKAYRDFFENGIREKETPLDLERKN